MSIVKSGASGMALGQIVQLGDLPNDGTFVPQGSIISRASYPAMSAQFPSPKLSGYNGTYWSKRSIYAASNWQSCCFGNNMFVASNAGTALASSADGITWVQRITGVTVGVINYVSYCNGLFFGLEAGTSTSAYITATDGITWTIRSLPSTTTWKGVSYGNSTFVAVGTTSNAATSTDGITWMLRTLAIATCSQIAYGNGNFVVLPNSGTIAASSTDGITWTQRTLSIAGTWYSLTYGNGIFVALYYTGSLIATYTTSTDGITWTTRNSLPSANWMSCCFGNGIFVAPSYNSSSIGAISTDGLTWAQTTLPTVDSWYSIAYGNNTFVTLNTGSVNTAVSTLDPNNLYLGQTNTPGNYVRVK